MEMWDLYDENRTLTGEKLERGKPGPEGRYHLIVDALFLNSKGETLLESASRSQRITLFLHTQKSAPASKGQSVCDQSSV